MSAHPSAASAFDLLAPNLLSPDLSPDLPFLDLPQGVSPIEAGAFGGVQPMALFLTEVGDTAVISMNDIHQGQIGDCFLLSPIGDLAAVDPALIKSMIHANADGSETVTLNLDKSGGLALPGASAFKSVTTTVTNVFPNDGVNNGATQDVVNGNKEIWAQVLEKAVAQVDGGYGAIAKGGNPAMAMEELTGHAANAYRASSVSASALQAFAKAGDIITFDTFNKSGLADNLVGSHAYMFKGVVNTAGGPAVQLANPWGFNQPTLVPVSQFASVFAEIDVGRVA